MNYGMIRFLLGFIMRAEALMMLPPLILALVDGDRSVALAFAVTMALLLLFSLIGKQRPKGRLGFYARDGFVTVGLVWVVVSLFGALPFWISAEIPVFVDALFESISGFTTTGASILNQVEALSRASILWRSISHYAGGMGVLVFVLAIVPMAESSGGSSLYLLRAESTGPQVGKLLPKMRDSAKILYTIYLSLTVVMIALLLAGGVSLFESVNISMSTIATGGFGMVSDSMASYSLYVKAVTGIFMALAAVNFNVYFLLLIKAFSKALFNEELHVYLGILATSVVAIASNLIHTLKYPIEAALGQAAFQVASIMSSTGFSTVDFNLWPEFSKVVLLVLMLVGACAGSTGGGVKVARIVILAKSARNSMMRTLRPRQVNRVRMSGATVEEETVNGVLGYMCIYAIIAIISFLLVSLDNFSMATNISAVMATLNNIGPGFDVVGPMSSFSAYSPLSKLILSFDMLAGRLELFPILLLLTPSVWRKSS